MALRRLSLLFIALICIAGSGAASAAAAPTITAGTYPAKVSGPQVEQHGFMFFSGGTRVANCKEVNFSGELTAASTSLALAGTYSECIAYGGLPVNYKMNGCTFNVSPTKQISTVPPVFEGTMSIGCPAGKAIEIDTTTGCHVSIGAQENLKGATFENVENHILLKTKVEGIKHTDVDGFACILEGSGTFNDGAYAGSTTLKAAGGNTLSVKP